MTIYSLDVLLFSLEPVCCSLSSSNCCFLSCIQISQEAGQVVWYSHIFKTFPQFVVKNHSHRKLTKPITWTTAFSNSMKLWAMPCRATQDRWVTVERSDKMWSTGERNGKPLQYSCLENPMKSIKRQNYRTMKNELPRSVGTQYATGEEYRNNSRKNEETEPKQKQHPAVDVTGDGSKIWCCKEQYCIGTWNVRSMNQGKLEVANRRWQEWTLTF